MPEETEKLGRGMEALAASIRSCWKEIASGPLEISEHWEIKRYIETSTNDLARLMRRMEKGRARSA